MMIRIVGGWVFLLVPAHPGSPGQRAIKRLLLLLLLLLQEFLSFFLSSRKYGLSEHILKRVDVRVGLLGDTTQYLLRMLTVIILKKNNTGHIWKSLKWFRCNNSLIKVFCGIHATSRRRRNIWPAEMSEKCTTVWCSNQDQCAAAAAIYVSHHRGRL